MTETIKIDELTCPCLKCTLGNASKKVNITYENGTVSRIRTECVILSETEEKTPWNAKFTYSEADTVRKEHEAGAGIKELAEKYGVIELLIYKLIKGYTYTKGGRR